MGAGHAVGALVRVHHGGAVGTDGHGAKLAGLHAGAEAQAAEGALQGAGGHLSGGDAILDAHIIKPLDGIHAAVAADESDLPLAGGGLLAHDGGDGGGVLRAGRGAGVDRRVTGHNGGSAARAAGVAAAAAVGAGQMAENGLLTGVLFHLKDLGGHGQNQTEYAAQDTEDQNWS